MNRVILIGRVGKDPEVKRFDNGGIIANFSIATDESYRNKQGEKVEATEWHNVSMNGKLAEVAEKWIKKGSKIAIEGKNKTRSYDKNGEKRYVTEVVASAFEFVESAKSDSGSQAPQYAPPVDITSAPEDDGLPF